MLDGQVKDHELIEVEGTAYPCLIVELEEVLDWWKLVVWKGPPADTGGEVARLRAQLAADVAAQAEKKRKKEDSVAAS